MVKKITRPAEFKLGPYTWKIVYLDIESADHGETHIDSQEIHINVRNKSEQSIRNTLLHELLHVCFEDLVEIITKMDASANTIEESFIRVLTPRLQELLTNNTKLTEYLFKGKK